MGERVQHIWMNGMAFCPACQEQMSTEEIDWETCDACGGEGIDSEYGEEYYHDD